MSQGRKTCLILLGIVLAGYIASALLLSWCSEVGRDVVIQKLGKLKLHSGVSPAVAVESCWFSSHGVTCVYAISGLDEINGAVWYATVGESKQSNVELVK
jgi:hypothetical protein